MFLFPLGLEVALNKVPWATILLVCLTTLVSVRGFELLKEHRSFHADSAYSESYQKAAKKFLAKECLAQYSSNRCAVLNDLKMRHLLLPSSKVSNIKDDILKSMLAKVSDEHLQKFNMSLYKEKLKLKKIFNQYAKQKNLLKKSNVNIKSSIYSIFLHGGYFHLFGNMIMLLILLPFLEMKIGFLNSLALYLITGVLASALYINFLNSSESILVGASTSVSGLIGAYAIFFYRNYFKVWVSFMFIVNKIIYFPVYLFIPIFFVASDLIGMMEASTNIAHAAHLLGMILGAIAAFIYQSIIRTSSVCNFAFEEKLFKAISSPNVRNKLPLLIRWCLLSPANLFPIKELFRNNQLTYDQFQKVLNSSIQFHKSTPSYYGAFPQKFLPHINLNADLQFLIKAYNKSKGLEEQFKLSYLISKILNWDDLEWNNLALEKFKTFGSLEESKDLFPKHVFNDNRIFYKVG